MTEPQRFPEPHYAPRGADAVLFTNWIPLICRSCGKRCSIPKHIGSMRCNECDGALMEAEDEESDQEARS